MKNYPLFKVHIPVEEALINIRTVLESGFINEGVQVTEFVNEISKVLSSDKLIVLNSCTSALTLALHLSGVGPDDEVISTPMTCVATNTPIRGCCAKIVWADIDPKTGMIDYGDVFKKITNDTVAVMAVAWAGSPPELDELASVCKMSNTKLILDAAHAFGAEYKGKPIHEWADYTCFPGTTRIRTNCGNKQIRDIKEGELVLTSSGKFKPVIAKISQKYKGEWTTIKVGQARISATSNHPVRIYRNGVDSWLSIGKIELGDCAYVVTKQCSRCSKNLIPYYMNVCKECYRKDNRSEEKRKLMQQIALHRSKKLLKKPQISRNVHHIKHVVPVMEEYRANGYRVIPMIFAFPDFIAIKDQKITAVEVESSSYVDERKRPKYEKLGDDTYDNVVWLAVGKKKTLRHQYEIIDHFARVPIWNIKKHFYRNRTRTVYNLTVADDPTYVAGNILVHNCYSFQAIKHVTTGDGGALICKDTNDYQRSKCLKWFGLDRDHAKDKEGNWKGQQWDVDIKEAGYKFNMNNVSAAIGLSQLKYIPQILEQHRTNAKLYNELFKDNKNIVCVDSQPGSSYWVYPMHLLSGDRDKLIANLNAEGIMVGLVHVPNDDYTAFKSIKTSLPGVRAFSQTQLNLPCGWWLSRDDVKYIANRVKYYAKEG